MRNAEQATASLLDGLGRVTDYTRETRPIFHLMFSLLRGSRNHAAGENRSISRSAAAFSASWSSPLAAPIASSSFLSLAAFCLAVS